MAPITSPSAHAPSATLPALLSLKAVAELDEQIRQATHIIRLPSGWETIRDEGERLEATKTLVRARAAWVLRWILDKLKDEDDSGAQARANPRAWKLVDWMLFILPASRSATQLRDADFLTILEKALEDNFEKEFVAQPSTPMAESTHKDTSESSETVQEDPKPSRKRKRTSGANTPSKRIAPNVSGREELFVAIVTVVKAMVAKSGPAENYGTSVSSEHMKVSLRTESAQAARIMKFWLMALQKLVAVPHASTTVAWDGLDDHLSLSFMLGIWEHRSVEANDELGASAEQFSAECLIPILVLHDMIHNACVSAEMVPFTPTARINATQTLERLLARHLFAPARASFLAAASSRSSKNSEPKPAAADALATNFQPLRAKIQQAAEIHDTAEPIPDSFSPMFRAVPRLLDMAIKFSPIRSPKSKIAGRPWIEAVFVVLAECAGCPLEAPKFPSPRPSIEALENSLRVLADHSIRISSNILEDLFWFHSGLKFPENRKGVVHWPLVASLIKLDPDVFLPKPRAQADSNDRPGDLSTTLFDHISKQGARYDSLPKTPEKGIDENGGFFPTSNDSQSEHVVDAVIKPLVSAFARNRDLLGFVSRWDAQLCKKVEVTPAKSWNDPGRYQQASIWEDDRLSLTLALLFEQSLTQTQILGLFETHQKRISRLRKTLKSKPDRDTQKLSESFGKAHSSSIILMALLRTHFSDETVETLKPQLLSLLASFAFLVSNEHYRAGAEMSLAWNLTCQIWTTLWPVELHGSPDLQTQYFESIVGQACHDVGKITFFDSIAHSYDRRTQGSTSSHPHESAIGLAALAFILVVCENLLTISSWTETIGGTISLPFDTLLAKGVEPDHLAKILDLLCGRYAHLINHIDLEARSSVVENMITGISGVYDAATKEQLAASISQSLLKIASSDTVERYLAELSAAVSNISDTGSTNLQLSQTAVGMLSETPPYALSRHQREDFLDKLADSLATNPLNASSTLSIMARLMELPNSTAKISRSADALFDISQILHDNKLESDSTLAVFQTLVELTLDRVLENKDQSQNAKYLGKFTSKLASATKKARKCFPARLSILRAVFAVQKNPIMLPVERYLEFLGNCLNEASGSAENILDAFNAIPSGMLRGQVELLGSAQPALRKWMEPSFPLDNLFVGEGFDDTDAFSSPTWLRLHKTLERFQLYPNMTVFLKLSQTLLRKELSAQEQKTILDSIRDGVSTLSACDAVDLVGTLIRDTQDQDQRSTFRIIHILIAGLDEACVEDLEYKQQRLSILPILCQQLARAHDPAIFNAILDSVDTILRDKLFLVSQHNFESVLAAIVSLSSRASPALPAEHVPAIYARLCESTRLILLLHRSRLGGRYHLLVQLLQNLLLCLFLPNAGRGAALPAWLQPSPTKLSAANASHYARLLSTLCSPTTSSVSKHAVGRSQNSLNDPVKAAKEYASHHLYPLLAAFCRFQLNGRLQPEVREKLMPGIWDVVAVANMDREALDGMNAGLDSATRSVWKGLWGEWRRGFGKRDGE
ncbi:Urb2/Npa2 family-domain-containing protein [Clohesyomyces aquaticus]|uniref:Urb2/Npa2 family-domain-containing protein n=1 Tax=Clohesyomyces aquaticus TaxID=1231657 RepID=A0A1Y1ZYF3_9PLEO|nr:Urb2/Npa2 family-domain-containing protein [Clohesyomyces aquaticus]